MHVLPDDENHVAAVVDQLAAFFFFQVFAVRGQNLVINVIDGTDREFVVNGNDLHVCGLVPHFPVQLMFPSLAFVLLLIIRILKGQSSDIVFAVA